MPDRIVVGVDVGGTSNNVTVMGADGTYLIDRLVENPSRVTEGPAAGLEAMAEAVEVALAITGRLRDDVAGVGLDTPGPASAVGVHGFCSEKKVRVSIRFMPANGRLKENQNSALATASVSDGPNSPRA